MENFQYSPLEILLLALVRRGVSTSYDLWTKAALPLGATSRALKRLQAARLLVSITGTRKSKRFTLTAKGEHELRRCWDYLASQAGPVSMEAALRVAFLGWLFGQPAKASSYVSWAIDELRLRASARKRDAEEIGAHLTDLWQPGNLPASADASIMAAAYRWATSCAEAKVTEAEAEALQAATMNFLGSTGTMP